MRTILAHFGRALLDCIEESINNDNQKNAYTYEELRDMREEYRMNHQLDNLKYFDKLMSEAPRPHRDYCKTLSDEQLASEKQKAWNDYEKKNKEFEKGHKKMEYKDYYQDSEFKKIKNSYEIFEDYTLEQQRRNSEKNPGKYPMSREHGWNLYKPDND